MLVSPARAKGHDLTSERQSIIWSHMGTRRRVSIPTTCLKTNWLTFIACLCVCVRLCSGYWMRLLKSWGINSCLLNMLFRLPSDGLTTCDRDSTVAVRFCGRSQRLSDGVAAANRHQCILHFIWNTDMLYYFSYYHLLGWAFFWIIRSYMTN